MESTPLPERHAGTAAPLIRTLALASAEISAGRLEEVLDRRHGTSLVVGFVSPHCDFARVLADVKAALPAETSLLLVTTAGELCTGQGASPYCPTESVWDRVVLQGFSRRLIATAEIHAVALPTADIRADGQRLSHEERMARLGTELAGLEVNAGFDCRRTFVLTFIDGLSHSENYLMEAIYRSARFPLLFVGGSAGGKLDFRHTYLSDGERVLEDHALLCFATMAPGMRYGVFKTQNFRRTGISFIIADADSAKRVVRTVIDPETLKAVPFLDALARAMDCRRDQLEERLAGMTFGVDVDGELYVRSVATLHQGDGSASFFCDLDFGDCLYLVAPTDFVATTRADFLRFQADKPDPLGGILNDCILRRLNNAERLGAMDVFDGIPLAGFSTFGELLGININQTLTAIMFYGPEGRFADDLIDRFPIHYAGFRAYFDTRATNRLRTLHGLQQERDKIKRALRREHDFSRVVLESMPGVFALIDRGGRPVLWNNNLPILTGLSPDQLSSRPFAELFHPEDQAKVGDQLDRAAGRGRADAEARLMNGDGQLRVHSLAGLQVTLDGESYTACVGMDITERNRAEGALQASRRRLKRITDSLFEGVLVIDGGGNIVFANPAAKRLMGWEAARGDIEGHPLDTLLRITGPAGSLGFTEGPCRRTLAEGETVLDEDATFLTADGGSVNVAYACVALAEEERRRDLILSFRDIGALRQAQREVQQASRLASVGQLAAGIAHEINTPVQYIGDNLNFISTALAKLAGPLQAAADAAAGSPAFLAAFTEAAAAVKLPYLLAELPVAVRESQDGVAQISRIVLSMKEFSHPGTATKTTTNLNRAIESTLTVSHHAWKHAAQVETALDPALPPVLCFAAEINQVLLNLVVNAAQAIEASGKPLPGTIRITSGVEGGDVVITVADSGSGVPPALRERIFDPFFTTKDVGKGTGQGLAICRDVVVTKHGGRLEVGGKAGEGATFIVRLPLGDGVKI